MSGSCCSALADDDDAVFGFAAAAVITGPGGTRWYLTDADWFAGFSEDGFIFPFLLSSSAIGREQCLRQSHRRRYRCLSNRQLFC